LLNLQKKRKLSLSQVTNGVKDRLTKENGIDSVTILLSHLTTNQSLLFQATNGAKDKLTRGNGTD